MRTIYIDPAYRAYYQDKLFDEGDPELNRDGSLAPFIRMQKALLEKGETVHTADYLLANSRHDHLPAEYYSFGLLENYQAFRMRSDIKLKAFIVYEPPVVDPRLYRELPALTAAFERVYVHNTEGDGYSLKGVDQRKLRKLYWPQPHAGVFESLWRQQDRQRRIVVINGNHKPASSSGELYSKRIKVMVELTRFGAVDLYGRGWERWWSRNSMWLPYWLNRGKLLSIYHGACTSKYDVMSNYAFALCFENMEMKGYITEKIFDCLCVGTIPIYWGATDISSFIAEDCYIDFRKFTSVEEMWSQLSCLPEDKINAMREAGKAYLSSKAYSRYYDSLSTIVQQGA